jgi:hypothetical protein
MLQYHEESFRNASSGWHNEWGSPWTAEGLMVCPKCGKTFDTGKFCRSCGTPLQAEAASNQPSSPSRHLEAGTTFAFFSPAKISNKLRDLSGHVATAIFGHVRLDLTARPLPPGETRISLYSIFGNCQVIVPSDVAVKVTGVAVLSRLTAEQRDIGNGVLSIEEYVGPGYARAPRQLHIDVASFFGHIRIGRR